MSGPDTLSGMLRAISDELREQWVCGTVLPRDMIGNLGRTLAVCALAARDLEDRAQGQRVPDILPENVLPFRRRA